ncbi:hypothetical protein EJ04DRAFT_579891 [Polyplosphaeria fusca]|uniref:RapZ C-terminal domain-containing protein n=1 Tax=Polyplosphaeria fusca TaxID=682080 RepID=A0A9P4UYY6_9PLEO|nr:hypothetical protein EJ04DRAFT_579891 [Polyplosphaeria fusca]
MSGPPLPILILYSHGKSPPLDPVPDLKYDLRSTPNPPKALRDVSDGRSKRIREHLLAEPKFTAMLEAVEQEVLSTMNSKIADFVASHTNDEPISAFRQDEAPQEKMVEEAGDGVVQDLIREPSTETSGSEATVLRVGCKCALGHHRSVAFVSELAARPWPKEWEVRIIHRDLAKKRAGSERSRQKASWKAKRQQSKADDDDHFLG